MLTHSSGQWMRDTFVMEKAVLQGGAGKNPAQAMGASITYMRRYAYTAIIGMTQEDEDACNVKAQAKQLAPELGAVSNAIINNDSEYLSNNWDVVTKVWGNLNAQQQQFLNNFNQG